MFRVIDKRSLVRGALNSAGYSPEDTIILEEDMGVVRVDGPLNVKNIIVHTNVTLVFEGHVRMGKNALGACVFKGGVEADSLNAKGDVLIKGKAILGPGRSVIEGGDLMLDGDLVASGDIVVHRACRITGQVSGDGKLACNDVWAPSIKARSHSTAQSSARQLMEDTLGTVPVRGFMKRLLNKL